MAKKIIGVLRPFDLQQKIYVYQDGNKIDATISTIQELNKTLFELIDEYDIKQVDLTGPEQFLRGIKQQLEEAELAKYSNNKITINLI